MNKTTAPEQSPWTRLTALAKANPVAARRTAVDVAAALLPPYADRHPDDPSLGTALAAARAGITDEREGQRLRRAVARVCSRHARPERPARVESYVPLDPLDPSFWAASAAYWALCKDASTALRRCLYYVECYGSEMGRSALSFALSALEGGVDTPTMPTPTTPITTETFEIQEVCDAAHAE